MALRHINTFDIDIDPETCPIDELKKLCVKLGDEENFWNSMQLATKRFINSIYGVFGSDYYNLANTNIAEAITLQGQHLIKFSVKEIDDYFRDRWHLDFEGHKKIAEKMKSMYPDFDVDSFYKGAKIPLVFESLQIYGDTDSAYVTLYPLVQNCKVKKNEEIDFCWTVHWAVMDEYLNEKFEMYAKSFHCLKNLEKFELEKISRFVIMLSKKNYMCDVGWIDAPFHFAPLTHITYTGYDVVKSSTTDFCRNEMKIFTKFIFDKLNHDQMPTIGELVQKLREAKRRFCMQSPNDAGKTVTVSDYDSFVCDDKSKDIKFFETGENGKKLSVPIHVRAAAVYNHNILYKHREFLSKYELIKSGDKVRFYYTSSNGDVFGFVPDKFPVEFAPPMDVETQFEKSLLAPLNRIIVALGFNEVPPSLTYSVNLF